MATTTTKLSLIKPDLADVVDVGNLNDNADDIDAAVGFTICTSSTRPATPWTGQPIFETDTALSLVWDGDSWEAAGGGGGGVTISATAPAAPAVGDLWWDSVNGELYVYYDDGTSSQWVAAAGPSVTVASVAPTGYEGQLWLDDTDGSMYVYYTDPGGGSSSWIGAVSRSGGIVAVKDVIKTDTFVTTIGAGASAGITGLSITHEVANPANKLIITATIGVSGASGQRGQMSMAVSDGTNLLGIGDTAGARTSVSAGGLTTGTNATDSVNNNTFTFVHTPGSGSKTYTLHTINASGGSITLYINRTQADDDTIGSRPRGASSLVIMEVAG